MTAWRSAFLAELGAVEAGFSPLPRSEKPEKPEKSVEKGPQESFSPFSGFSEGGERKNQLLPSRADHVAQSVAGPSDPAAALCTLPVGELGEPLTPCSDCVGGQWWRLSCTDPGFTGRWWCAGCSPAPTDRWCDAAVVPESVPHDHRCQACTLIAVPSWLSLPTANPLA